MRKNKTKKCTSNNSFFYLLLPPIILSFLILVIVPLVTYSSDIFSNDHNFFSIPEMLNKDAFEVLESLDAVETEEQLILKLDSITSDKNIVLLKDNLPVYNLIEIENAPTNTTKKLITLNDGSEYTLYFSYGLVTKRMLFIGLIFRYILITICILSFIGINRMRKHLKKLEKATSNIASGDYDTPINIEKKDSFIFLDNSLENMRIQIKEDRHQLARFFAGVSHDLKTPLSSIIGYTEALRDGMAEDKETQTKYLNIIHDKSEILVERISSLINYIRITDQGFKTTLKSRKLYPFLENFCKDVKQELDFKEINFESYINFNKEYETQFDSVLLTRALENLIDNSVKYGDCSKPIIINSTQDYNGLSISIINSNKIDITGDSLNHIFEPFYRGDNSRKGLGFGLGLATVQSIVASHGWKITASVDEIKNTISFTITIPVY
ncbi:MAG: HAMP domain-containing sensor histidine kinase [Sphaerochaetaceae bacterium]|nr:HAMP domain-containing sensor histidine kinase [Sphaerochaetaceae bacterium]MDC7237849.1 HAMP domain-containing sensor histidine kinase [Sphaerochaetaceae bacterium]MDC7249725.1 HAMP domain-containing sensor histidine kinase [Sphaerochaetaceae bacterium]